MIWRLHEEKYDATHIEAFLSFRLFTQKKNHQKLTVSAITSDRFCDNLWSLYYSGLWELKYKLPTGETRRERMGWDGNVTDILLCPPPLHSPQRRQTRNERAARRSEPGIRPADGWNGSAKKPNEPRRAFLCCFPCGSRETYRQTSRRVIGRVIRR